MTIKLGRVLLLALVYLAASRETSALGADAPRPGLSWALPPQPLSSLLPAPVVDLVVHVTTLPHAAGMFGLGLGIRVAEPQPIP